MTTVDLDCPTCGTPSPASRIRRDFTEDGVIEVWEGACTEHGTWVEQV